ncbi:MAG: hypothetical protein QOE53_2529 [Pseudonocardiales bacterium]|nr:hypothetical protein [Pseudonocardiales bacterium]
MECPIRPENGTGRQTGFGPPASAGMRLVQVRLLQGRLVQGIHFSAEVNAWNSAAFTVGAFGASSGLVVLDPVTQSLSLVGSLS